MVARGGPTGTGSRVEGGFLPPTIETARIVNVNVRDWSVDCVSEHGNKRFTDLQWMCPYLHYESGEGFYAMPEVGAIVWICQPSDGYWAERFILGYKAPHDERLINVTDDQGNIIGQEIANNWNANRQNLNPGDQMWRGRDDNFIILRRGGVIQIGANAISQRLYIPAQNIIRDVCENYELRSLAGELCWRVDRTEKDTDGNQKTRFRLSSKTFADEPGHAVILTTGSHEDEDSLRLSLIVNADGQTPAQRVLELFIEEDGSVKWAMQGNFAQQVAGDYTLTVTKAMSATSTGDMTLRSKKTATLKGDQVAKVEGRDVTVNANERNGVFEVNAQFANIKAKTTLGPVTPNSQPESLVKGDTLTDLLKLFFEELSAGSMGVTLKPGDPVALPGAAKFGKLIKRSLSDDNLTT